MARRALRLFPVLGLLLTLYGVSYFRVRQPSPVKRTITTPVASKPVLKRPIFKYSVVPGGVYSAQDVQMATGNEPLVRAHYAAINTAKLRPVVLSKALRAYVSYRRGRDIYWTAKPVSVPAGEAVLSDGLHCVRARCGNRIAETPQYPVNPDASAEPKAQELDTVVSSIEVLASLPPRLSTPSTSVGPETQTPPLAGLGSAKSMRSTPGSGGFMGGTGTGGGWGPVPEALTKKPESTPVIDDLLFAPSPFPFSIAASEFRIVSPPPIVTLGSARAAAASSQTQSRPSVRPALSVSSAASRQPVGSSPNENVTVVEELRLLPNSSTSPENNGPLTTVSFDNPRTDVEETQPFADVPEPAAFLLVSAGLLGLIWRRRSAVQ